jgi:hypothetical protein
MKALQNILVLLLVLPFGLAAEDTAYQPFVLASVSQTALQQQTEATLAALQKEGFVLAGQYAPLEEARVMVVTSPELLELAGQSDKGGYAAAQRVSVVRRGDSTEVAFVNPLYIQHAYRVGGDLQPVYDHLVAALGMVKEFGAEKAMTASKLAKYHYMVGMQRFDDPYELGSFDSHAAAVAAVEQGLARDGDGLSLVYRIDIPGKNQTVFGVGLQASGTDQDNAAIDEAHQLSIVDFEGPAKVAYFPYEVLVDQGNVEALHMRFRMAVHFPDLSMMGKHGFTQLMSSPGATGKALQAMVNGK